MTRFLVLFLTLAFEVSIAAAQNDPSRQIDKPAQNAATQEEKRPNLLLELGLSSDQIDQIRSINKERRPRMEAAQKAMRNANAALDGAIYADVTSADEVTTRLKEFQAAQAQVVKLRAENEFNIRRILTPEQLVKFRELRRAFAEKRENLKSRLPGRRGTRLRRFLAKPGSQRPF
ncbi:MAG: Spy/CpxP family protein refolding chaperone [Pyrinomonadaceae bacterium]